MTKTEKRIEELEKRVAKLEGVKDDPFAELKRSLEKEKSQKEYIPVPYLVYPRWPTYPSYPYYQPYYCSTSGVAHGGQTTGTAK